MFRIVRSLTLLRGCWLLLLRLRGLILRAQRCNSAGETEHEKGQEPRSENLSAAPGADMVCHVQFLNFINSCVLSDRLTSSDSASRAGRFEYTPYDLFRKRLRLSLQTSLRRNAIFLDVSFSRLHLR